MIQEEKDVLSATSADGTSVSGETQGETAQSSDEVSTIAGTAESQTLSSEGNQSISEDVDSFGVPWRNRAAEWKRKSEDNTAQLSELKVMVQGLQSAQQQTKPTKEQLMAFISNDDTEPSHRNWALKEMDKLEEVRVSDTIRKEFVAYETKRKAETDKAATFNYIIQRHPDICIKDGAGRFVGWNTKNPIVQRMDVYMRNPEIANNPQGLRVALALAKDDLSGTQVANQQKLQTQVKTLQKGTLVEGGSPAPVGATDNLSQAKANLRKSGSKKDALAAVTEWHKKQGKFD